MVCTGRRPFGKAVVAADLVAAVVEGECYFVVGEEGWRFG